VVPVPPPGNSGAVKYSTVVLSLAYDTFGTPGAPDEIPATVRILKGAGTTTLPAVKIEVGRQPVHFFAADEQAASVELDLTGVTLPPGFRPLVTALVEFATP
jgi:hypothetical protein